MRVDLIIIFALFSSLLFYVLTGGADYGAGIWSIFRIEEIGRQTARSL